MTTRRGYVIVILIALCAVAMTGAAQTQFGRVFNHDCEQASAGDPTETLFVIPGWTRHDAAALPSSTARIDGLGKAQSAACVVVGAAVLQSLAFTVEGGEALTNFSADVWEIRGDSDSGAVRGDSVVVLEFSTSIDTDGDAIPDQFIGLGQFELHCDEIRDAADDGALDGSDECLVDELNVAVWAKHSETSFECSSRDRNVIDAAGVIQDPSCAKYDAIICNHPDPSRNDEDCSTSSRAGGCRCVAPFANDLVVPAGATSAHVLLGGSMALDDLVLAGVSTASSITAFDNIVVV